MFLNSAFNMYPNYFSNSSAKWTNSVLV